MATIMTFYVVMLIDGILLYLNIMNYDNHYIKYSFNDLGFRNRLQ